MALRYRALARQRIVLTAGAVQIAAAQSIRVRLEDDPALVPLETLPGRDDYEFPPGDRVRIEATGHEMVPHTQAPSRLPIPLLEKVALPSLIGGRGQPLRGQPRRAFVASDLGL